MDASLKAFMKGIIDYAGLFPPADLSLDIAIRKYSEYRKIDDAWMLSRFIMPGWKLDELNPYNEELFQEGEPFAFSVLGKGTETVSGYQEHLDELIDALQQFHATHGDRVTTDILEIKLPHEAVFANDADLLSEVYSETMQRFDESSLTPTDIFFEGYFEENWKKEIGLAIETLRSVNADFNGSNVNQGAFKLRCGGVEAHMFPSVEQVAFALNKVREQNVAIKCTAGLHHPVRHYADSVKTKMHGFFNVFGGAMLSYAHDLANDQLEEIIREEDPDRFSFDDEGFYWNDLKVSTEEIEELRDVALISFGSCSFDEPREDLEQLDLLDTVA
ncbi:hypothetical protein [Fodinibius halophilus]|uniref:Uncharacterized protein n=1 Tax=Fodinibius halophilus TaxID=1736908 RepID=A0A6M1T7H3_9BACT|nr:hypothetical protein [Fodinibius halophilus]NGP88613.1 hypothetical protein [Fodinibius halophilus]